MKRRDDLVCLKDMLSHSLEAVEILGDMGREDLARSRVMQLALTRLVEIVGEAANRVPDSMRQTCPAVPWLQIIGMRNRLVHGYDVIDYDLLWNTITCDLPPLIAQLESILAGK